MAFPLFDLPYVPKMKILRFLRNKDLVKILRTSRSLKTLVRKNFRERRVSSVVVTMVQMNDEVILYEIDVKDERNRCSPLEQHHMEYTRNKSEPNSLPFFLWFAEIFTETLIYHLCLKQFSIDDETVKSLGNRMAQNGISTARLTIEESTFGTAENCVKLLSAISPKMLTIQKTDFLAMNFILTDSFLDFIPSLEKLFVNCDICRKESRTFEEYDEKLNDLYWNLRLLTLPDRVEQLPSTCYLSFACIVDFKIIKRKIHRWFFDRTEEEYVVYQVSLVGDFCNTNAMLDALELPEAEWIIRGYEKMEIRRSGLDRLLLMNRTERYSKVSDAFEWLIKLF